MAGDPVKLRLVDLDESIKDNSERGRLAAAVREGRRRSNTEHEAKAKLAATAAAARLEGQATAHKAELARAERLHGKAHYWQGAAIMGMVGLAVGSTIASLIFLASMRESFTNARDYGASMVATGAAQQMVNPPERCIPGETLSDGRVCPQQQ